MSDQPMNRGELLKRYASGPDLLEQVANKLSPIDLEKRFSPEEWSIRDIIHHIVDGDDIWNTCIKAALGNPGSEFSLQWYWDRPQLEWSKRWHYEGRSLKTSLILFRANREHIVELLRLDPSAWDKYVKIHWPGEGGESRITVEEVVTMHVNHLIGHLKDFEKMK